MAITRQKQNSQGLEGHEDILLHDTKFLFEVMTKFWKWGDVIVACGMNVLNGTIFISKIVKMDLLYHV